MVFLSFPYWLPPQLNEKFENLIEMYYRDGIEKFSVLYIGNE